MSSRSTRAMGDGNMVICGSCYTLVTVEDKFRVTTCPRCKGTLQPTSEQVLGRFVENGIDPTNKGVRVKDAQNAAKAVLDKLAEYERFISFTATYENQGEDAYSALLLLISRAQSLNT